MRYFVISCLLAASSLLSSAQTFQEVQKLMRVSGNGIFSGSIDISGDYAILGSLSSSLNDQGKAFIFKKNTFSNWNYYQTIYSPTTSGSIIDEYGYSVSINGNYIVVGSPDTYGYDTIPGAGFASVYKLNNLGEWEFIQKLVASDRSINDYFGYSVAISGDYISIGAPGDDYLGLDSTIQSAAGSAYVFKVDSNGVWNQLQKLTASDGIASDEFGVSIDISGDNIIIGAHKEDPNVVDAGSAYIFKVDANGDWNQVQKLTAFDRDASEFFGRDVAISNNRAIIGTPNDWGDINDKNGVNRAGSAYIFEQNQNGIWIQVQKIVPNDREEFDHLHIVDIRGDLAVVGTYGSNWSPNSMKGKAYVFSRNSNGTWTQTNKLTPSQQLDVGDNYGRSVSIEDSTIFIGARYDREDECGNFVSWGKGTAYIFEATTICSTPPTNLNTSNYKVAGNNSKATLSWERNKGAYTYQIQGGIQGGNPNNLITINIPCGTSEYEATGIGEGQCYEWLIRSMCHDSTWSPWSPFTPFCVPTCPDLNNIQTSINGNTVTFSWDVSEYAVGYVFQATTNPGNYNAPFEQILSPDTANSTTIGPIPSGNYKWRVRNGCSASPLSLSPYSTDQFFTISSPTKKAEPVFDFTLFPNPANDIITIQIIGDFAYEVYDIDGRKILQGNENRINASDLPEGLYNVVVRQGESVSTKRLVIVR